jgi:aryl-alcohol dehydrogenase-like predicted oxidoreductase
MLKKRELGKTGLQISPVGLGTVKFGRNEGVKYPQGFDIPPENELADLLALSKELGINVLDTAPSYGLSEERLGRLLKGQRADWVIVGKVGEEFENGKSEYIFSPAHFEMSVERSLKRLQTDYIDVLLIHCDASEIDILNNDDLLATMHSFKERGLVQAIGASTRSVKGGILSLRRMDTVMACYNPLYRDEEPVLDYAALNGGGVLLKKVLASGHVDKLGADPVQNAMDFVFSHAGTDGVILGTINPKHLRQNVEAYLRAIG